MTIKDLLRFEKIEKGLSYGVYLFFNNRSDCYIFIHELSYRIIFNGKFIYATHFIKEQLND